MGDNKISNPTVNKLLYTEKALIEIFGTVLVENDVLQKYVSDLYLSWENNEMRIPYTSDNLKIIIAEKRKVGSFEMMFSLEEACIVIRAKNKIDLTYLTMKYKF